MKHKIFTPIVFMIFTLFITSCASTPKAEEIPDDASPIELSQKGQSALDRNNYKAAEFYYQTMLDRHSDDPAIKIAAEFEIAHIRIKQKKWADAQPRLEKIIQAYESVGGANLPPEYLVLAKNDLAKIPKDKLK